MSSFVPAMACVAAFMSLPLPADVPGETNSLVMTTRDACERFPGAQDPDNPAGDGEPWTCEAVFAVLTRAEDKLSFEVVYYPQWPPKKRQRAFGAAWYVRYWNDASRNFPLMWEAAKECEPDTPIATERWHVGRLPPTPSDRQRALQSLDTIRETLQGIEGLHETWRETAP